MIRFRRNITGAVLLVLLVTGLSSTTVFGQKRKRSDNDTPSSIKQREAEFYFTEGEKYYILEDYAKALIYYQRAIESNPSNPTIHYKIAEVLAKSNKPDDLIKASVSIENALRLDRSNKFFYLTAATIYNSMARFDKAAEVYEQMIAEVPGTEEYLYEVAAVYQYANRIDDAIKAYNRAEAAFGVNEISSVQKIRLYLDSNRLKEAVAEGEKLMQAFPDEERYVMAFTEVLSQKSLRNEAIQYLEKFTASHSDASDAAMLLAGFYRDTNQEQKARPLLLRLFDDPSVDISSKLIVLGAYSAELNQNRQRNMADDEKEEFALSLLEKLLTTDPDHSGVHIIGGDLYLSTGKPREAQRQYLMAAESGDANYEVWENLLLLETQLEQFDNVLRHAEEALELFPNQGLIHYFNGFAQMRKRLYDEAIFSFEQAKRLSASNPSLMTDILSMLGDTYFATRQYDKSDKAFDDALTISPDNASVLNNYSYYLALRKENLEKAEKMSATLVKNHPDNPAFLDTHAWVLYVRQKYREAKKIIEKAISTGNANATHFEHYGDILYQLGDVDGAVIQWEKARGMNANSEILNKKIANRKIYE